jgi:hypothetical protein
MTTTRLQEYLRILSSVDVNRLPLVESFERFLLSTDDTGVVANDSDNITIPQLHPFNIPTGSNIESAKIPHRMTRYCQINLITANFGSLLPTGPVQGGFLPIGRDYGLQEGVDQVKKLARQTERKFRAGTPLELLLYMTQDLPYPNMLLSLGKFWNRKVLNYHRDYQGEDIFRLTGCSGQHGSEFEVFIVEDLPLSHNP